MRREVTQLPNGFVPFLLSQGEDPACGANWMDIGKELTQKVSFLIHKNLFTPCNFRYGY